MAGSGGSNSVVESQPSKLLVAGSIPVSRSILRRLAGVNVAADQAAKWEPAAEILSAGCEGSNKDLNRGTRWASNKQPSR